MFIIMRINTLDGLDIESMDQGKEVEIKGVAMELFFNENYMLELKEKAMKYDELMFKEAGEKTKHLLEKLENMIKEEKD